MLRAASIVKPVGLWQQRNPDSVAEGFWDGCLGYWSFSEMGSTFGNDLSGNGNRAVAGAGFNALTDWRPSPYGPSIDFNGTGNTAAWNAGNIPAMSGAAAATVFIVARVDASSGNLGVASWYDGTTSAFGIIHPSTAGRWWFRNYNGSSDYGYWTGTDGTWYRIGMRFDGSGATNADRIRVWVDGKEVVLTFVGTIPASIYAFTSSVNLALGARRATGDTIIDGGIALAIPWNRALPAWMMEVLGADPFYMIRRKPRWVAFSAAMGGVAPVVGTPDDLTLSLPLEQPTGTLIYVGSPADVNLTALLDTPAGVLIYVGAPADLSLPDLLDQPTGTLIYVGAPADLSLEGQLEAAGGTIVYVGAPDDVAIADLLEAATGVLVYVGTPDDVSQAFVLDTPAGTLIVVGSPADVTLALFLQQVVGGLPGGAASLAGLVAMHIGPSAKTVHVGPTQLDVPLGLSLTVRIKDA